MLKLYNTLTKQLEEIKTNENGFVTVYNCGPTVYSMQHIGNYRAYSNWDILHRALLYLGFKVKRIMNITDVGHLTSDEDFGEDKMEKGAKSLNTTDPYEVANYFIRTFLKDMHVLNMLSPSSKEFDSEMELSSLKEYGWIRATESIKSMIDLILKMQQNGFIYETKQAVYFDISKYSDYTKLSGQKLEDKLVGVRDSVNTDLEKKNPADFVLWMKKYGEYENHVMFWDSPWGVGFPGWHIECSAMGITYLGNEISIHTGGIEHIPVHHPNERAQNFGALGKEVVDMWVHNEHLQAKGGEKLSKSLGNAYTIPDLLSLGFDPLDIRLLLISANYRIPLKFSLESLESAKKTRTGIKNRLNEIEKLVENKTGKIIAKFKEAFVSALESDLNVSLALATLNDVIKSDEKPEDIFATVVDFDKVFGLKLSEKIEVNVPDEILKLLDQRVLARNSKDFLKADEIRDEIFKKGYIISDSGSGQIITKK